MSKHVNPVSDAAMRLIEDTITDASVHGCVAATRTEEDFNRSGSDEFVRVERIQRGHAAGWRVTDSSLDPAVGFVFVNIGLPGRYTTHEWPEAVEVCEI